MIDDRSRRSFQYFLFLSSGGTPTLEDANAPARGCQGLTPVFAAGPLFFFEKSGRPELSIGQSFLTIGSLESWRLGYLTVHVSVQRQCLSPRFAFFFLLGVVNAGFKKATAFGRLGVEKSLGGFLSRNQAKGGVNRWR